MKTSPEYTRALGLWEMHVIAKSNRLQWVKKYILWLICGVDPKLGVSNMQAYD